MSVGGPTLGRPWACSGDIYSGVPITVPAIVRPPELPSVPRAKPKSVRKTQSSSVTIIFEGLMSRWMTFCLWA